MYMRNFIKDPRPYDGLLIGIILMSICVGMFVISLASQALYDSSYYNEEGCQIKCERLDMDFHSFTNSGLESTCLCLEPNGSIYELW